MGYHPLGHSPTTTLRGARRRFLLSRVVIISPPVLSPIHPFLAVVISNAPTLIVTCHSALRSSVPLATGSLRELLRGLAAAFLRQLDQDGALPLAVDVHDVLVYDSAPDTGSCELRGTLKYVTPSLRNGCNHVRGTLLFACSKQCMVTADAFDPPQLAHELRFEQVRTCNPRAPPPSRLWDPKPFRTIGSMKEE